MIDRPVAANRQKTLSGIGWSVAAKVTRQAAQLFFQLILARLLSPEDFGIIAMIIVFTTFAEIVRTMGLGAAIIQKQNVLHEHYTAAFWANAGTGLVMNLLMQISAPAIAFFYGEPRLEPILRVFSLIFLISSFNIIQEAQLQKNLEFKRLFLIELISVSVSGIVAVILAINDFGVWSLVWQYVLLTLIATIVLWFTSSWRPSFSFSIAAFREIRGFGLNLIGHELLNFASRNVDKLLIGRILGASALGIYSRAYFLMLQPVNITNQVLARVMFPVLSRIQHDPNAVKRAYLTSTNLVAFVILPVIGITLVAAKPLIVLLLGGKWTDVAPLLQVFCLYAAVDTIGITTSWIYKALGRTDLMLKWGIYNTTVTIISITVGLQWGIEGVAWGYTLSFLLLVWLPGWTIAFRLIQLPLSEMFKNLFPPFLCTSVSVIIVHFFRLTWMEKLSAAGEAFALLILFVVVYTLATIAFNRSTWRLAVNLIKDQGKKRRKRDRGEFFADV